MQLQELAKVANMLNEFKGASLTVDVLSASIEGMSTANKIAVVTSTALTNAEKIQALQAAGLTVAEAENAVATASVSSAQTVATGTTVSLTSAFQSLSLAVKGAWLSIAPFLSSIVTVGLIAAPFVAMSAITKHIQKIRQETIDAGNESHETIKQIQEDNRKLGETVDTVSEKFSKYYERVNTRTNKNISLSNEEFEDYLSLNNELADSFPEIIAGYDSEGNAILDLGNNAETATQKINELYEAQKKASAVDIMKNVENEIKGLNIELTDLKDTKGITDEELISEKVNNLFNDNLLEDIDNLYINEIENKYKNLENAITNGVELDKYIRKDNGEFLLRAFEISIVPYNSLVLFTISFL